MLFKKTGLLEIDRNSTFASRVLIVSLPTALVNLLLVIFGLLSPFWAIAAYALVVVFNMIFLLPISLELSKLKKYINTLAQGDYDKKIDIELSENEAKEIADAVNSMHQFWVYKTDALEAQAMSDTAVLDTLPDPILMIDRAGNILGANLSARRLLGSNITDKNIENVFDSTHFIEAVSRVLKKETEMENLIFDDGSNSNKKIYAHIKQLPWFSKGRAVAVVSIYDLTKAVKIEKMQSDFVANASHELRTPLSIISGFIETLQTTAKDDEKAREQFLKIMSEQAAYMSMLIENLLSLSRIELQQDQSPEEKVDVTAAVEDAAEALSLKAAARKMNIELSIEENLPKVTADLQQIKQLLQNLIDNAIKYGISPSDISVEVKSVAKIPPSKSLTVAQGPAVAISINNKGPKISPENLARLTERFYRMQEHKNLNVRGTGLGLSIAKHIIMRHHGNLTVTSTNYKGTTFTVYLPQNL